ncbi:MAG: alpha/beta hydrolase [Bacillota bacterium]|nr:alpha/beta hydrolase [Bacillota bacterium]
MVFLKVFCVLIVILGISIGLYIYHNLNYDKADLKNVYKVGFKEKQVTLQDGSVLNYGEGPSNGPALFLIHGQEVSWEDYAKVLPQLSKYYHIYAVDCYGHGESSKNPEKYSAEAIGKDLTWFIENVIKEPVVVSGHSSGGLLTAWLAANSPKDVRGIVLEDPPFFSTEPSRTQKTFAWVDGFNTTHKFLNQTEEKDYVKYYMENCYMKNLFGKSWNGIEKSVLAYRQKHPNGKIRIFYLPPSLNQIWNLVSGSYDIRFGDTFYDCSWFKHFDQAETLSRINCPSVLIHTSWSYDKNGILLAAMDENDATRAHSLIKNNELIEVKSGHGFHDEKPKDFIKIMKDFRGKIK